MEETEACLKTNRSFHAVAAPEEAEVHPLPFYSYLIGIEKAARKRVGAIAFEGCQAGSPCCFDTGGPYFGASVDRIRLRRRIEKLFRHPKSHFVSHVVRYDAQAPRYLHNVYAAGAGLEDGAPAGPSCLAKGWDAVTGVFALDLAGRVAERHATHILVYATGWNTAQFASIKNYTDWWRALMEIYQGGQLRDGAASSRAEFGEVAPAPFRPIFVGLSWSADWPRFPYVADFINKAHDADEVGLTWANLLVNRVLKGVAKKHGVRIVLVGHSFGARLLSRAVHSAPLLILEHDDPVVNPPIDLFVGLQGAFPYKRFVAGRGCDGSPYADFALRAQKFLFTSSAKDRAMDAHWLSVYIGNDRAFAATRKLQGRSGTPRVFEHSRLIANGSWECPPSMDAEQVAVLDATALITSHNDVYGAPIARFVLRSLARYAPARRCCTD
jgi:hypothetical protein